MKPKSFAVLKGISPLSSERLESFDPKFHDIVNSFYALSSIKLNFGGYVTIEINFLSFKTRSCLTESIGVHLLGCLFAFFLFKCFVCAMLNDRTTTELMPVG